MTDTTWKSWERRIAKIFNGKRRGADYVGERGGKSDVIAPGWCIECKVWTRPTFAAMLEDAQKAEERRDCPTDIPVAIMKKKGSLDANALVVFRLETFEKEILPRLTNNR